MPYAGAVTGRAEVYHTLELTPRFEQTTYTGDIQDMTMIEDGSYDSALCFEVLEHVPDPRRAMSEIHRILAPRGVALISVPHLSRLHDEPHDYYRFTRHGLDLLFNEAGFQVLEIRQKGGLLSFLGHQASSLLLSASWHVPVVRQVAWFLNKWLITVPCHHLDRALEGSGILALGYIGVGQKTLRDP
jgi:SAM-dependent methyltransferase